MIAPAHNHSNGRSNPARHTYLPIPQAAGPCVDDLEAKLLAHVEKFNQQGGTLPEILHYQDDLLRIHKNCQLGKQEIRELRKRFREWGKWCREHGEKPETAESEQQWKAFNGGVLGLRENIQARNRLIGSLLSNVIHKAKRRRKAGGEGKAVSDSRLHPEAREVLEGSEEGRKLLDQYERVTKVVDQLQAAEASGKGGCVNGKPAATAGQRCSATCGKPVEFDPSEPIEFSSTVQEAIAAAADVNRVAWRDLAPLPTPQAAAIRKLAAKVKACEADVERARKSHEAAVVEVQEALAAVIKHSGTPAVSQWVREAREAQQQQSGLLNVRLERQWAAIAELRNAELAEFDAELAEFDAEIAARKAAGTLRDPASAA